MIPTLFKNQKTYFDSGVTRSLDARITLLKKLKKTIRQFEAQFFTALFDDLKKPKNETFFSELYPCIQEIDTAVAYLKKWVAPKKQRSPFFAYPTTGYTQYEPHGTVLIFAPWNYPVNLTLVPLIGAIAAGNCVIVKPSEFAPHTAQVLKELIEAVFDPAHVACVLGDSTVAQELLTQHSDYIFFTGSTRVGKIIMHAAAEQLTPVTLELGGKCPTIVDHTTDLAHAAQRIIWGKLLNAGQTCIAPDYVLVERTVYSAFLDALVTEIQKQHTKKYNRIINRAHFERLVGLLRTSTVLYGGSIAQEDRYIEPSLVTVADDHPLLHEEIFGPILPLISFSDTQELITRLRMNGAPLALYIFSDDTERIATLTTQFPSGAFVQNDVVIQGALNELPFGGKGPSGFGRYKGEASFKTFSYLRTYTFTPKTARLWLRFSRIAQKIMQFFI